MNFEKLQLETYLSKNIILVKNKRLNIKYTNVFYIHFRKNNILKYNTCDLCDLCGDNDNKYCKYKVFEYNYYTKKYDIPMIVCDSCMDVAIVISNEGRRIQKYKIYNIQSYRPFDNKILLSVDDCCCINLYNVNNNDKFYWNLLSSIKLLLDMFIVSDISWLIVKLIIIINKKYRL